MKLADLDAEFLKIADENTDHRGVSLAEADGVMFLCPKCFIANGGPVRTHSMICWRPHVPQTRSPTPGRWEFHGTGLHDLTLVNGSSSVKIDGGCNAHFFVRNGAIEMLAD